MTGSHYAVSKTLDFIISKRVSDDDEKESDRAWSIRSYGDSISTTSLRCERCWNLRAD